MKPIDILILILFAPPTIFLAGFIYMSSRDLCKPGGPIFCIGINWLTDLVFIPLVIFSGGAGLFFLCRRLGTEHI